MPVVSARSYTPLREQHLQRLSEIAAVDRRRFVGQYPQYRTRLICVTLAQGAALHWVDGRNGVKDLDVWTFYAAYPGERFPWSRRVGHVDFGASDLGRPSYRNGPRAWQSFEGRRVDLLARALPVGRKAEPVEAVCAWLEAARQPSPRALRLKPVVMIDPPALRGHVIWSGA
ncbi:MAG TPA: hypothetical protein VHD58_04395 [Mycobacteriales bacterium]|nr:hypothetical protein [Mycobacteriales bacterium]